MDDIEIGAIGHEGIVVRVAPYNGDDWEDHTIHIWDDPHYAIDGSVLQRPIITLSEWETLELIELLAKALRHQ